MGGANGSAQSCPNPVKDSQTHVLRAESRASSSRSNNTLEFTRVGRVMSWASGGTERPETCVLDLALPAANYLYGLGPAACPLRSQLPRLMMNGCSQRLSQVSSDLLPPIACFHTHLAPSPSLVEFLQQLSFPTLIFSIS